MEQRFYTAVHKDKKICKKSSSGGAFTALSDAWFDTYKEKAVVYGSILDENLKAKHIRATTPELRDEMRGSKYIESYIRGISEQVEKDLKNGMYVFFTGTPCQNAGIKLYLKNKGIKTEDNLITVEVICHGVAEEKFFRDYITHLEHKYKSKATKCNFRAKKSKGRLQDMLIEFENGKEYYASSTNYDWFYSAYVRCFVLKSSCYKCKFAKRERFSDISLGDNWAGYNESSMGESLIITNSDIGEKWVVKALVNMEFSEVEFERVHSPFIVEPPSKPKAYNCFWEKYNSDGYLSAQKILGNNTLKGKFIVGIALVFNKLHLMNLAKKIKRKILK